jgi:hypothetical protein
MFLHLLRREGDWFGEGLQKIWSNNTFLFLGVYCHYRWCGVKGCSNGHGGGEGDDTGAWFFFKY